MRSVPQRVTRAGIPIWWADSPEPFRAELRFRVGSADERLPESGLTHFVEHLAMAGAHRRGHESYAYVEATLCVFGAEGERAEVLEFLTVICAALTELDMSTLEVERRVLRVEADQRGASVAERMLAHRFGITGHGAHGQTELGLRWLGAAELRAWCAERFTRGNASVWMTGEPGEDVALPLPEGPRWPVPPLDPLALRTPYPAFVLDDASGAAVGCLGRRSTALSLATVVAQERLTERLRRQLGLAYTPRVDCEPLDARTAHVVFRSDGRFEEAEIVAAELWRCVRELLADGVTGEEVERARRVVDRPLRRDDAVQADLEFAATCELTGMPYEGPEALKAQRAALDAAALGAALRELLDSALVAGARAPDGVTARELVAPAPVEGERFESARADNAAELRVGERGLTWIADEEELTVEWARLAAVERRLDGELRLFTRDDAWFGLRPYDWEGGERALAFALARVPAERFVPATDGVLAVALEAAVARSIVDRKPVAEPLRDLVDEIQPDEGVVELGVAAYDERVGVLVVTGRRVYWTSALVGLSIRAADLRSVTRDGAVLDLVWAAGEGRFTIDPEAAAEPLERAIQDRIQDRGCPRLPLSFSGDAALQA